MKSSVMLNPKLDLVLERTVDISPEQIWKAWTTPEIMKQWFAPLPWKTVDCKIDLRPGGIFESVMQSPEGEKFPGAGCYLEIIPNEKLVWTDCLLHGYRPNEKGFFTAMITLESIPGGKTKYTAYAFHKNEADCKTHREMGFETGWSTCLDQLVQVMKKM